MKPPLDGSNPRRILLIQLRQIGDVLLTTPLVAAVRRRWPSAYLAFAVEPKAAPILEGNPDIDALILRDPAAGDLPFYRRLKRQGFDLVVDFLRNPRSGWMTLASGAAVRVGWDGPGKGLIYNVRPVHRDREVHSVEDKGGLLAPLGISGPFGPPILRLQRRDRESAERFLVTVPGEGPVLLLTFSSPRPSRRWTREGWASLCRLLAGVPGSRIVLAPGPGDEGEAAAIRLASGVDGVVVAPRMSLREHAALIERADLLLGVCSAPRHIAVAVGTPSLILTGPTKESSWRWPSVHHRAVTAPVACRPCHRRECPEMTCMQGITPESAFAAAVALLSLGRPGRDR
jgi:ADP-heptose:LPS heptosyltransferase